MPLEQRIYIHYVQSPDCLTTAAIDVVITVKEEAQLCGVGTCLVVEGETLLVVLRRLHS